MNQKEQLANELNNKSKEELVELLVKANMVIENLNTNCEKMSDYINSNNRIKQLVSLLCQQDKIKFSDSFVFNATCEIENFYFPTNTEKESE